VDFSGTMATPLLASEDYSKKKASEDTYQLRQCVICKTVSALLDLDFYQIG